MSSAPSNVGGKSLSAASSNFTAALPVSVPSQPSFDSSSSRRSALSSPSLPNAAPRKGQSSRKQHRDRKKPQQDGLNDDDAMAEIRAVRNASSRRGQTSITHLLNYSAPRHYYEQSHGHEHGRTTRRHATWGPGSGYHAADKAKFVHANYRFVVSPVGSYMEQANDADKHLEWSDVVQIIASAESQTTSCPICLSEPVAPRMARCGHIFCLPCLIRFMNSTNDDEPSSRKEVRWKKCPICEDQFQLPEVRPVRFYAGQENPMPRPGDDVVLRLMVREAGSTLAMPKEGGVDVVNVGEHVPWHFAANVMDYARIMKGTDDYMAAQYDGEMDELQKQAHEDEVQFGVDDGDWTNKAIRAITTAKERIREPKAGGKDHMLPITSRLSKAQGKKPAGPPFHFYTAPPHLYLSPLDIRILKTKFGGFSNFPSTLLPRVEHISTGHVVDDGMRKRAKYLGHLPHGCLVSFLECDWTDIVPAETLDTFAADLERRRKMHRDKAAQEERERVQAERMEAAAIGRGAPRHFDQMHDDMSEPSRPIVNDDDFLPLAPAPGTTPPNPRLGFEQLAAMSTSPSASKTVWGTRAIPVSPELRPVPERRLDDGWLKDDDFLGAAELQLQMETFGINGGSSSGGAYAGPATGSNNSGGGKKKRKQKITLMSTGSRRGG